MCKDNAVPGPPPLWDLTGERLAKPVSPALPGGPLAAPPLQPPPTGWGSTDTGTRVSGHERQTAVSSTTRRRPPELELKGKESRGAGEKNEASAVESGGSWEDDTKRLLKPTMPENLRSPPTEPDTPRPHPLSPTGRPPPVILRSGSGLARRRR
ncbi:hypothetical protein AAFF_G00098720 [Aldrovandia affinis]|uniref:Uncharacterized protein n=1 Tax=Aldrovandia affinis TaxID=143900 RepID=A0AAD7RVD3_9TELE|nr:hypothetical protein AAFF_G00098720 [Aldrovandia affinis]